MNYRTILPLPSLMKLVSFTRNYAVIQSGYVINIFVDYSINNGV